MNYGDGYMEKRRARTRVCVQPWPLARDIGGREEEEEEDEEDEVEKV